MTEQNQPKKKYIIFFAIALSIILYFAGVFSGLYANKLVKESTEADISNLKKETSKDLELLQSYVDFLDSNLKNMQLEQTFIETLDDRQMCNFSRISLNELFSQLTYYWGKLPYRIEEYEKYNELSRDYNILKKEYAHLSIRTWILARSQHKKCNIDLVHGLYFYSADCEKCIKQGEQLDILGNKIKQQGREIIMFPIDFYLEEPIVENLKKYYDIRSTPAIIINDQVMQGRLFTSNELLKAANSTKK